MPAQTDIHWRDVLVDGVAVFLLLPGLLAAVHFSVPVGVQDQLALDYGTPRPVTLWTSAFVHASDAHLYGNLAGGFGGALVAYVLCLDVGRRRWFRLTVAAFLVVLPVAVSLASLGLFWWSNVTDVTGRGFSGVAAGFAGFTITALSVWVREYYPGAEGYAVVFVVALLGVEIHWIYGAVPSLPGLVTFATAFSVALGGLGYRAGSTDDWHADGPVEHAARVGFFALVVVFLGLFAVVLFPPDPAGGGSLTNVFSHVAGVVFGAGLSYVTSFAG